MSIYRFLGILFSLFFMSLIANQAIAKSAHVNSCSGTDTGYRTAKKACKSGDFAGQTIVTCNRKGKQKDRRVCNADGAKVGVYLGHCSGASTGFKNINKACKSGDYFGDLLVKCRKGRVKKRLQCAEAESDDDKVVIFKNSCGSSDTLEGRNLRKACKFTPGETLVKCRKKGNIWKERKSMFCTGKKDRFKIKKCSIAERQTLLSDYDVAENRVDVVLGQVENLLRTNTTMERKLRRKMEVVRRKLEKMQTAMDRPRTYVCKTNQRLCKKANAHTMFTGHKVKLCDQYFTKSSQLERASILVHEISHHKTQTTDKGKEHGSCLSPNLSSAANNFHRQAEYYEHIIQCGLYLPN